MRKLKTGTFFSVLALSLSLGTAYAQQDPVAEDEIRTIRLRQNDAQVRFISKVYELKHVSAQEILPFMNAAVSRYNRNSSVRRVTGENGTKTNAILVNTGRDFIPYVDDIVAALDRPGIQSDDGNIIKGTGIAKLTFAPKYRAAYDFSEIIDSTLASSTSRSYVNPETNLIFWCDELHSAERTLGWVKRLDRPLPQVSVRINYYEIRDSDLKDWGFDYLAWKNGPGVNLFNAGYNAGQLIVDELIEGVQYAATSSWGMGGFFTAPMFDMSFIRCLQQSGGMTMTANASLTMVNTPIATMEDLANLRDYQKKKPLMAPFIYRISLYPEYQSIEKNTLGRTFIGKSFYEDDDGVKHSDPPVLDAAISNPFICFEHFDSDLDAQGFIASDVKMYERRNKEKYNGGLIFDYQLAFKNVIERGNTGSQLSNASAFSGSATIDIGNEKVIAVYQKENDVEQTVGIPVLCRIPVIKYLVSTVTSIKEQTYIVITAEAELVHPDANGSPESVSLSTGVERRIENPFRDLEAYNKDDAKTSEETK